MQVKPIFGPWLSGSYHLRSEMMAGMRIGGVALGSRNKLRLLVAARSASAGAWQTPWVDGPRRVQELQELQAEESSSRTGRQGDSTSAAEQASQQESTNEPTGTIFGVSGDGAPHHRKATTVPHIYVL